MTIDEAFDALDLWTGVDDREKRRAVLQAVADRARAEERAATLSVLDEIEERYSQNKHAVEWTRIIRTTWSPTPGTAALARIEREAAARAWWEAAEKAGHEQLAAVLCHEGAAAERLLRLMKFYEDRAAALREAPRGQREGE